MDNGLINLEVLEKHDREMRCRVLDGGVLKSKRHVTLPGVRVNLPALTQKDRRDILFGLENNVDFIALSFVREANDIRQLKELMDKQVCKIKIIAKILPFGSHLLGEGFISECLSVALLDEQARAEERPLRLLHCQ